MTQPVPVPTESAVISTSPVVVPSPSPVWVVQGGPSPEDWIVAGATVAALLFAAWSVYYAAETVKREGERHRRDREDLLGAQARLVFGLIHLAGAPKSMRRDAMIVNNSDKPITILAFKLKADDRDIELLEPDAQFMQIAAGTSQTVGSQAIPYTRPPRPPEPRFRVEFLDASGLRWARANLEEPVRLTEHRVWESGRPWPDAAE